MVRMNRDGSVPKDNPFVRNNRVLSHIFSYGHRNPQGLSLGLKKEIWQHEHGPRGGDELNIIRAGKNYGWPLFTYGREYHNNARIGRQESVSGFEPPIHYWIPSPAPLWTNSIFWKEIQKLEGGNISRNSCSANFDSEVKSS